MYRGTVDEDGRRPISRVQRLISYLLHRQSHFYFISQSSRPLGTKVTEYTRATCTHLFLNRQYNSNIEFGAGQGVDPDAQEMAYQRVGRLA